jgi:hypothetical protein
MSRCRRRELLCVVACGYRGVDGRAFLCPRTARGVRRANERGFCYNKRLSKLSKSKRQEREGSTTGQQAQVHTQATACGTAHSSQQHS